MSGFFKKKGVSKVQTDITCNHRDALPDSDFCPRCGAKIERIFSESGELKSMKTFDINNCYICVLHFRIISAWITPSSYPVEEYVVVYNGKYSNVFLECNDDEEKLRIKVDREELTLEFNTYTEKMSYTINEVCEYHVPLCDAMESWKIIISDAPIQHELFMPGYLLENDSIYYNIKDMQEREKRLSSFSNPFWG